jgi:hypothetical protein
MCVQKLGYDFEGPVQESDFTRLETAYPGIDFRALTVAMSQHGFVPLTCDLVLIGATLELKERQGIRFLPFTGLRYRNGAMVKLPVMDGVVGWFENTALGTDMWLEANTYLKKHHGVEVRFTMDCGCGIVSLDALKDGSWHSWLRKFNAARRHIYGRTDVVHSHNDNIAGTDITSEQLIAWQKLRRVLWSLKQREEMQQAAA